MLPDPFLPRRRGRPKGFDDIDALEAATRLFWARGYEQAPMDALCRAMHMPRASLYQRFGGKEGLFLAAIDHYARTRLQPIAAVLTDGTVLRDDLLTFFERVVAMSTDDPETPGCLISSVLADAARGNPALGAERDRRFGRLEALIADRLAADGWPEGGPCPPVVAATLAAAMARGIVLRARSGHDAARLHPVGRAAVDAILALRDA
ncbi:TetR/AcrR family transcriptional regulator [Falsirhodobacter algicola]|uniref:TetR family transcriptional regulator n=1 Tax=Falsirhodobacter algicola TaxID=2692330 RepID=A0A8J8SLF8_9RHOB|nr:TetR/AcrR family transcriptional regulator [Falsirhodobacter algicola]QUS37030.1 TetR family transcriptional regulator [Falsirhodobacter algicola]